MKLTFVPLFWVSQNIVSITILRGGKMVVRLDYE